MTTFLVILGGLAAIALITYLLYLAEESADKRARRDRDNDSSSV